MTRYEDDSYYRIKNRGSNLVFRVDRTDEKETGSKILPRIPSAQSLAVKPERPGKSVFVDPGDQSLSSHGGQGPSKTKKTGRLQIPANRTIVLPGAVLNRVIDQDGLEDLREQPILSIRNLNLLSQTDYTVRNQTRKRIGIRSYDREDDLLFIPPFGSRKLNSEILKEYDFLDWERQNLIEVEQVVKVENETGQLIFRSLVILFGLFLMIAIPLVVLSRGAIQWSMIVVPSAVFIILITVFFNFLNRRAGAKRRESPLWEWLKLTPGIGLVLLAGFGLPLWIVYFFGDGQRLVSEGEFSLVSLGRLLQVGFISISAMLPALLYYLFGRQQIDKLREDFFREVMWLDTSVQTLSEARTKYESLLDSVYGAGNSNSPFSIVLLIISTALLVMGWVMALSPISPPPAEANGLVDFFTPRSTAFTLGFMGAYFFAINMIFRRYIRADLTPKTYAYITVRLLITLVLVWGVSILPQFIDRPVADTGLLAVAFLIGIFPETGLAIIKDFARGIVKKLPGEEDALPLTDLEGINLYDRARLLEEGIENIENLAHHDLIELLARTRIPTPRLVDMFDQAILYLHMGIQLGAENQHEEQDTGEVQGEGPGQPGIGEESPGRELDQLQGKRLLVLLKSYGIRTATDLITVIEEDGLSQKAADTSGNPLPKGKLNRYLPVDRLRVIVSALRDDEWVNHILTWRAESLDTITSFREFYENDEVKTSHDSQGGTLKNQIAVKPVEALLTQ